MPVRFLIMFCITIFVYFSVVAVNFISKNCFFQQLSASVRGFLFSLKLHLKNMLNSIFFQVVVGDRQTQLELSMVFLNSSAVQYNTKTSKTSVPSPLPVVTQMVSELLILVHVLLPKLTINVVHLLYFYFSVYL